MASSTELFPELWLPMTTMLGSLSASLWSMLMSMVRISMSFLVRCIKPFWRASPVSSSESRAYDSEAERDVAAIMAARAAASSPSGRLLEDDPESSSLRPRPFPPDDEKISFKNWGVSNSGSLTSDIRSETVLTASEAVSKTSVIVSCTVENTSFDFFLNSGKLSHEQ